MTSLEDLHPGDVILLGLRKERHYVCAVYQGDGRFLTATQSLSGGIFNDGNSWSSVSFDSDTALLTWLNGPVDASRYPDVYYEGYLVLRPSRVYNNINVMVARDITDAPLTADEKSVLSALTPEDWEAAGKVTNKQVIPWIYNSINVSVSLDNKTVDGVRKMLFTTSGNYYTKATVTSDNSKYLTMLVNNSWGGSKFATNDQHTLTNSDLKVGDIFCAASTESDNTRYWVALYQGNGKFLAVESSSNNSTRVPRCIIVDSITDTFVPTEFAWKYYYVLRPQNLAGTQEEESTEIRDISTGALTEAEKAALSALTPGDWNTAGKPTNKNVTPWIYNSINVSVSLDNKTVNGVRQMLFAANGDYYTKTAVTLDNSKYHTMLLDNSWGGSKFAENDQHTPTDIDLEVGDIFCAASTESDNTRYWVALYQGSGKFLVVESSSNNNTRAPRCITVDSIASAFAPTEFAWQYYYVLRPSNLADAA